MSSQFVWVWEWPGGRNVLFSSKKKAVENIERLFPNGEWYATKVENPNPRFRTVWKYVHGGGRPGQPRGVTAFEETVRMTEVH